jgi:PKD repeat protein
MKINYKKRSVALVLIAMISLLALVSSASAISPIEHAMYPHASFAMSPPTYYSAYEEGKPIQFTDKSTPGKFYSLVRHKLCLDPIKSWSWDFGDGTTSSLQNPERGYTRGGDYTITLKVTSSLGRSSTATKTIEVAYLID